MPTLAQQMSVYKVSGSTRGLAARMGLDGMAPVSVAALLRGAETRTFAPSHEMGAGDVATRGVSIQIWSDGRWHFWGKVFDHGTLSGDDFDMVATLYGATDVVAPYFRFKGHVGHQSENAWDQSGVEPRISAVWQRLKAGNVNWHLSNNWGLDAGDVLKALFVGVVGAGALLFVNGPATAQGNPTSSPNDLK